MALTLGVLALAALGPQSVTAGVVGRRSVLSVSDSDWDAFNASVSGRLQVGVPMLAPCYTNYNGQQQVRYSVRQWLELAVLTTNRTLIPKCATPCNRTALTICS